MQPAAPGTLDIIPFAQAPTLPRLFAQRLRTLAPGGGVPRVRSGDRREWQSLAQSLQLDPQAAETLRRPEAKEAVLRRIAPRVAAFPSYTRVRQVDLALEPWTTDNGLITPTLKLRRRQLEQRFAGAIQALNETRA